MKVQLVRKKYDKNNDKTLEVSETVDKDDLLCFYKDRYGVFILLRKGYLIEVNHTMDQLEEAFEL